jgi:hypothetical protein
MPDAGVLVDRKVQRDVECVPTCLIWKWDSERTGSPTCMAVGSSRNLSAMLSQDSTALPLPQKPSDTLQRVTLLFTLSLRLS